MTVKARQRHTRILAGLVVGVLASGSFARLDAQQTLQRGQTPGPRFMVPIFRSSERNLGLQFAEAARTRMMDDFNARSLWIIPKSDITNTLEASGYSVTEALNPNDTRALAVLLRAEELVEGTVTKTPSGFRVDASLMLVRGDGMAQPLPSIESPKLDDAAKRLSNEIQQARKQIGPAQKCMVEVRQKKYAEARKEAQAGIAAYPNAVMARVCIAEIFNDEKAAPDSMVRITEEILKIHPQNRRALALAADAYSATKQEDKYIQTLTTLLASDPTNVRLQQTVVNELARTGKANLALPIIDDAVKQNPGDPQLLHLQWLVHLANNDYKGALAIGEELARADTAAADTNYFVRMAAAAVSDSQPQKASEIVARGVAKFPSNTTLLQTLAQLQRQNGQTQQAVETLRKVVAADPKAERAWLQIAQAQIDMNAPTDEILQSLHQARAAGDSATLVGGFALTVGNTLRTKAGESKSIADYRSALKFFTFADSVSESDNSKFLIGITSLQLGHQLLTDGAEKKSCAEVKEAHELLTDAQLTLPRGGRAFPEPTRQALGSLQQLLPYSERTTKALCK